MLFYLVGRLAPSAKYPFWWRRAELGRRCSTPGPEVYAKLRQLSGRHFNCGFQRDRGPLAALQGGGNRAFRFSVAFSRLSPGTPAPHPHPLPPLGAGEGRLFGLFPQGPPGSSNRVGEAIRAEGVTLGDRSSLRVPAASDQYWRTSVRSGSISPPAVPGVFACTHSPGFRSRAGPWQGKDMSSA